MGHQGSAHKLKYEGSMADTRCKGCVGNIQCLTVQHAGNDVGTSRDIVIFNEGQKKAPVHATAKNDKYAGVK